MKKAIGIILIVLGAFALLFNGINYTSEETVVDLGALEISADQEKTLNWPMYAGAILAVAGVLVLVVGNKKS